MKEFIMPVHMANTNKAILYFPYAGAGAFSSYKFLRVIPKSFSLFAIQLPGRENKLDQVMISDHEIIYCSIAQELQKYSEIEFSFWGHSLGSIIAFETIFFLQTQNMRVPKNLIVTGARALHELDHSKQYHQLSDANLKHELKLFGGFPNLYEDDSDFTTTFLPILRQDFFLFDTYKYTNGKKISANISVFVGNSDYSVPIKLAEGWKSLTTGDFYLNICSGNHFFINELKQDFTASLDKILNKIANEFNS